MRYSFTFVLILLTPAPILAQQQQQAQLPSQSDGGGDAGAPAPLPPPIYSSGSSIYNSSTAVEGAGRGAGAVIQASGEYNYNTAAGLVAASQAESQSIANSAAALNNYFTLKKINESYRALHQGSRTNSAQAVESARKSGPTRLSSFQFDSASGEIKWPDLLKRKEFQADRRRIDDLFAARVASNSGLGTKNYEAIIAEIDKLQGKLKNSIDKLTPAEYVQGKRFLINLAYESQFKPAVEGVAER